MIRLDGLVQERRNEEAKRHKSRHFVRGRKLGAPKEKPLPLPGRARAIALEMIDMDWLSTHPESRNACFIDGYTKEEPNDEGFEGDGEGEENLDQDQDDQHQYSEEGGETQEDFYTMDQVGDDDEDLYASV